jgi:hypothetical protein
MRLAPATRPLSRRAPNEGTMESSMFSLEREPAAKPTIALANQ